MSDEQVEGDWSLRQERDNFEIAEKNQRARADAAETRIEELTRELESKEAILKQAWNLRDETMQERDDAQLALKYSLRLLVYLIADSVKP